MQILPHVGRCIEATIDSDITEVDKIANDKMTRRTRLTRQKVDKLMGRDKKRRKTDSKQGSSRSIQTTTQDSEGENETRKHTRKGNDIVSFETDKQQPSSEPPQEEVMENNYREVKSSDEINVSDLQEGAHMSDVHSLSCERTRNFEKDVEESEDIGVVQDDGDVLVNGETSTSSAQCVMNADNLLGCLLTCGSQRLSSVMYNVVRTIMSGRQCGVCGASVTGAKLPGLTYLKTNLKPKVKLNLLPRHEVIQVRVDRSRAGAKLGIGKYASDAKAPLTIVKPSEWARLDFLTPSVRDLIWEDSTNEGALFSNIESTPIVRHRSFFPAVNTVRNSGGLESLVGVRSQLQLTFVRNSRTDKAFEKVFFGSVRNEKVKNVDCALVSCEVIDFEYVSDDRKGHKGIIKDTDPVEFERHEGSQEKAGDVIFYLKCQQGMARLVNSHNYENRRPCRLEICNGQRTGCKLRSFPVEDVVCVEGAASPADDYVPNKGRLVDGTKYYTYRFLLYTDGFNAHRSRLGSMDGMYMMPLGLPIDRRTEAGCLHKICLAPPGVAATDVMDVVIDDLTEGMRNGIEVDDCGGRALIFPDLVCYTGDSPALASVTGTKGHSADCPCHACSFRKDKEKVLNIVGNEVSTSTCFAKRTHTKIRDIERQEGEDSGTLSRIGVSNSSAPLMKLSDKIKGLNDIPKTSAGKEVVPNYFDAYRFALISPDHVFLGLIQNALELFLKLLKRSNREKFDIRATEILRFNGMYGRTTILNSEKNIMKTTISEAFAILFVAPMAIKCCNYNLDEKKDKALKTCIELIQQLSGIIVKSQQHPKSEIDNQRDLRSFNDCGGKKRLYEIMSDVKTHIQTIEKISRIDPTNVGILDKPNMHRFVELFVHTLPMFGSMRYIEELILEKAHQSAKKAVDMSNNKNEQLQAMADYLFDDFTCRLKSLTTTVGTSDEIDVSEDVARLARNNGSLSVGTMSDKNVLSVVRILGKDVCHRKKSEEWRVEKKSEFKCSHDSDMKLDQAKEFLEKAISLMSEREEWKGFSCTKASSATIVKPVGELDEVRRAAKVSRFDVLELHCREGCEKRQFVLRRTELDGERRFLVVIGFLNTIQDERKVAYAVGYFMNMIPQEHNSEEAKEPLYTCARNCVVILELSRSIRKAFVCHACWTTEKRPGKSEMTCSMSCSFLPQPNLIVESGKWVLKGRKEGFPPRSG